MRGVPPVIVGTKSGVRDLGTPEERIHYFGEFTVPDEDSDGEYERTGEWEGHDVVEWTGEEDSYEYWECDDCRSSRQTD